MKYEAHGNVDERARELLKMFEEFYSGWRHGAENEHFLGLANLDRLSVDQVVHFFNAWRPLSRHQPQLLLLLASALTDAADWKKVILDNFWEEAGLKDGHDPHFVLLDRLITKLGGNPTVVSRSEEIMNTFHQGLRRPMTKAESGGVLAGIENPALDISGFFHEVVRRSDSPQLIDTDRYLKIHVLVEPIHIIDTHETALRIMDEGPQQREEVLAGFREVMDFWATFWRAAFSDLRMQDAA